ncbi:MAG: ribosomal RNA small subunit methyltransferase A [Fusobacteria bacterium]|nr:ribosomal RNA small subunit methyltransferase A [Fusobacteriota bacterium]
MDYKHKKKYGQNFLNDSEILERIIEVSNVTKDDFILEVGPGDGALTELLIENAKNVLSVEVDKDLVPILEKKFKDKDNFKLILKDILELDINNEVEGKAKVVANIPYYITSPIINKFIENRDKINEIYIMIQKEVALRIVAKAGVKDRSILTLAIEYFGESELLFYIPKEKFTPSPKVDSAFIKIKLRKDKKYENIISEEKFMKFVKGAFANKRKNILNNIKMMGYDKDIVKRVFDEKNIDTNKRAEDFTIDEFIEMINIIEKEMIK